MEENHLKLTDIRTENESDKRLVEKVFSYKQEHVFRWWNDLSANDQKNLLNHLRTLDFELLQDLIEKHIEGSTLTNPKTTILEPPIIIPIPDSDSQKAHAAEAKEIGEKALRAGKVAVVTVAGGLGTRLGADRPKGTLPISPIKGKSIFQLHAEKIQAVMKKYDTVTPWYIMTSKNNEEMTHDFFEENRYFGLNSDNVSLFTQGELPVIDLQGRLLMDSKSSIVTSPNGHGGTLLALKERGVLSSMNSRGIKHIFYHQVDNILIKIADPVYLGYHISAGAKMSPKVVRKTDPDEKVGIVGIRDGHLDTIEYSELSDEEKHALNPDGTLKFGMGNPAIYLLDVDFVEKINESHFALPYHKAVKKVPCIDGDGCEMKPAENNATKFEMFIFDALKHADKSIIMEVVRENEFSPVKNATGKDSPDSAKQSMINMFGRWLAEAGIEVPTDRTGNVAGAIEVNPLYALDSEELKGKIDPKVVFNGELNLQ
ncbi:MAG: UDPGP type 1 family protein [Candidatus Scalindua sp.]|jgi:UDP-N-acetylglucosamine/UDP-N-acetylgalactosamine diphosphorylase|nr:UDPGP type 1 family protein [Candidatus Scalindua sp.]MDV5166608.1 UDPGP type 1 family protein [Candidatus Scalindua sp.]